MNANLSDNQTAKTSGPADPLRTGLLRLGALVLTMGAILFLAAGRLNWVPAWAYLGVYASISAIILLTMDPDLRAERAARSIKATKTWDKVVSAVAAVSQLGMLVVAGLDVRNGWSAEVSPALQVAALVVMALSLLLGVWAIASNKYFSSIVRVQDDRGHTVATGGPYRYVRHPSYVGFVLCALATPLIFGSLWALIPAVVMAAAIVIRTALEDRTLQEELDGYKDYARRVRYRLLPGVW